MGCAAVSQPDLDAWLADPRIRTRHQQVARSDGDRLWEEARKVRIGESGLLGRLICWRIPQATGQQTYEQMFTSPPFVVLESRERRLLVGVCGRIWSAKPRLAPLDGPEAFRRWTAPGTVRVLFAQWTERHPGGAALISEVRVHPVDRRAGLALAALSPFISRFQALIGTEPLRLAAIRSESAQSNPRGFD